MTISNECKRLIYITMRTRILFLTVLLLLTSMSMDAQEGTWKGKLSVQGIQLPIVFHFEAGGCTMDSPSQGAKGIKAEKTVTDGNGIKVTVGAIGAVYEAKHYGDSICGTFRQNGMSIPLKLMPGDIMVKRPQTPHPPFPYQEENVNFVNGKFTFNGTLVWPKGYTKKTPVVLLVTGSGQQNRDEELFAHKPFAVIADALARNGIASLRYDDRGYGDKTVCFADFTTEDFRQDAEAAIKFLRSRFGKVGILGHSEGGTIALVLAAEHKVDFAVSLAGMVVSGNETLLQQNRLSLASTGLPAETVNNYCAIIDRIFTSLIEGKQWEDIKLDDVPADFKLVLEKQKEQLNTSYFRHFLKVDAGKLLPLIKCPVLALNGRKDMQVDCETNLKTLEKGLVGCKHEVQAIDDLNHLFQHCKTGNVAEYQQIEETISPEVLSRITTWIQKTT